MNLRKRSAVMSVCVTLEFKAGHHGVAECPFHEIFVGEPAGEVLQCCNHAGVGNPQKLTVVVQGVQ